MVWSEPIVYDIRLLQPEAFPRMRCSMVSLAFLVAARAVSAQVARSAPPVFTEAFPPEEFAARRAKLMERLGDGVAILQGATEKPAEAAFRQNNQFFYLTGVEVPRALLIVDGRSRRSALFIPDNTRRLRQYGPLLNPDSAAPRITGIETVMLRDSFGTAVAQLQGRSVYVPFRAEVLGSGSGAEATGLSRANKTDPWDGRMGREEAFLEKLRAALPSTELKDLDPFVDAIRAIKSAREIAVIREATRIAGLG